MACGFAARKAQTLDHIQRIHHYSNATESSVSQNIYYEVSIAWKYVNEDLLRAQVEWTNDYVSTPRWQYCRRFVARKFNQETGKGFRPDENVQNQNERPCNMVKNNENNSRR